MKLELLTYCKLGIACDQCYYYDKKDSIHILSAITSSFISIVSFFLCAQCVCGPQSSVQRRDGRRCRRTILLLSLSRFMSDNRQSTIDPTQIERGREPNPLSTVNSMRPNNKNNNRKSSCDIRNFSWKWQRPHDRSHFCLCRSVWPQSVPNWLCVCERRIKSGRVNGWPSAWELCYSIEMHRAECHYRTF